MISDYKEKYKDEVKWFETLVEPPRTGELYIKGGYTLVGITKGFTCKRVNGKSSDKWSGQRIWNREVLKPKLVFIKRVLS